jgi:hypothetical protein
MLLDCEESAFNPCPQGSTEVVNSLAKLWIATLAIKFLLKVTQFLFLKNSKTVFKGYS